MCSLNIFGSNLFGWGAKEINGITQLHADRIVSFFKDEPIAGAFLAGFIFLVLGYLLEYKQNKFVSLIFISFSIIAIMLTGERSNFIKTLIGLLIFLILINKIDYKKKYYFSFLFWFHYWQPLSFLTM